MRAIDENRLLALTGIAGIHVLNTGVTALVNRKPVSGISGAAGAQLLYALEVPTGAGEVRFQTLGGTGDITLYVKHGAPPTATDYDEVSMQPGTSELAAISQPQAGIWYVRIVGEAAFQGVTLSGAYR